MAMRKDGVIILDEHFIEHTSEDIEGVECYYSPAEDKYVRDMMPITLHYWASNYEYPIVFNKCRRLKELEKCGKAQVYQKKNVIARVLRRSVFSRRMRLR